MGLKVPASGMSRMLERSAFTLIELLIALVVLSIGIIGYMSTVSMSARELWLGNRDTRVALLMADQLERLRALAVAPVSPGIRTEGDYQLDWSADPADSARVILVATYPARSGVDRADTLVAYVLTR